MDNIVSREDFLVKKILFSKSELSQIDDVAPDEDINLWARSSIS